MSEVIISLEPIENPKTARLETSALSLEVTLEFGPRIRHLSRPGKGNLLFWDQPGKLARGAWKLRGGHRIWVGRPMADEAEETYAEDNSPVQITKEVDGFAVRGAVHPVTRLSRGFRVSVVAPHHLRLTHFAVNESDMLSSGLLWPLTCTLPAPNTKYLVPMGNGSSWDTFTMVHFRKWSDHGQGHFEDNQFVVGRDLLEVTPKGFETKRMFRGDRGIFAMNDPSRESLFIKKAMPVALGLHPKDCNLACYIGPDNFMVEMESMGPETPIPPGGRISWDEDWFLHPYRTISTSQELLQLT